MKRKLLVLMLVCACVLLCACANSATERFVFRNVNLGMSLEEVDNAESQAGEVLHETYIVMDVEAYGHRGDVVYSFDIEMSKLLDVTFQLEDGGYSEFNDMLSTLSDEYGTPDSNEDKRNEEYLPIHRVRWITETEVVTLMYMNGETAVMIKANDGE